MTTKHTPAVEAAIAKHAEARAAFEKLRDDADRLATELETHRKAAAAAEAEANAVRESARALIRDGNSSPKKIHELKAQERAAYTLAEDYRSIAVEVEALFALAKVEVGDAKKAEHECFANIVAARRDEEFAALPENLQPVIKVMALIEHGMRLDGPMAPWTKDGLVTLKEAMLGQIFMAIERAYYGTADDAKKDLVINTVARPTGRERFDTVSPATRHRLTVKSQGAIAGGAASAGMQGRQ